MVYDATAAAAARREADGERFVFRWDGQEFTVPKPDDWPAEALDRLAQGRVFGGFAMILGDEQAAALKGLAPVTNGDVQGILGAAGDHYGVGSSLGE